MPEFRQIDLDQIDFEDKSYIFRHSFDVSDLTNSIEFEGLIYPPLLLSREEGKHQIIAGYRRLLAHRQLGLNQLQCVIYAPNELAREEFLKLSIAENTKRKDLKPIEIAEALLRIKEELSLSDDELAQQFGETFNIGSDTETVKRYLKLNLFDPESKDLLADTKDQKVEFTLANVEDNEDRDALLGLVKEHQGIRSNQLERIIENAKKIQNAKKEKNLKGVFEEEAVRDILSSEELTGSKKINAVLGALEETADPERRAKMEYYQKAMLGMKDYLQGQPKDYSKQIQIKKQNFGDQRLKVVMDIGSASEFSDMLKILYEMRKKYISPLLKL